MTSATPNLRLATIDEDHAAGVAFNLVMLVWRNRTLAESYRAAIRLMTQTASEHASGAWLLEVIETTAVPPDGEAQKAFGEMMKLVGIRHFCLTLEGSGFRAASLRAIVSGAHALSRPAFTHAVHDRIASAASWAAAHNQELGAPSDALAIQQALQSLRRLHAERYPAR